MSPAIRQIVEDKKETELCRRGLYRILLSGVSGWLHWSRGVWTLTDEVLLAIRETALATKIIEPQVTRAIVGRMSNALGQSPDRGRRKSSLRCVLL